MGYYIIVYHLCYKVWKYLQIKIWLIIKKKKNMNIIILPVLYNLSNYNNIFLKYLWIFFGTVLILF